MLIKEIFHSIFLKNKTQEKYSFLIIHYTGMQSARVSLKRLKNPKVKVSCHYLIDRNGI